MPPDPISDKPGVESRNKARLRRDVRARRAALPAATARGAADRAVHRLWSLPCMARAASMALYLPTGAELDCTPLVIQAWRRGRAVFLPVICGDDLRFAPFNPGSELRRNRFGIYEPVTTRRLWRSARQLQVIVAPLVAFDLRGQRLGAGGGYYDRTLAFRQQRPCARRPHFVALAFELQKVEALPAEGWDVRLDAVVTEDMTYRFA